MSDFAWLLLCALSAAVGFVAGLTYLSLRLSCPAPLSGEGARALIEGADQWVRERICRRRGHRMTPWRADRLRICRRCGAEEE